MTTETKPLPTPESIVASMKEPGVKMQPFADAGWDCKGIKKDNYCMDVDQYRINAMWDAHRRQFVMWFAVAFSVVPEKVYFDTAEEAIEYANQVATLLP